MKRTLKDIERKLLARLDYYDGWKRHDDPEVLEVKGELSAVRSAMEEIRILKLERRSLRKLAEHHRDGSLVERKR